MFIYLFIYLFIYTYHIIIIIIIIRAMKIAKILSIGAEDVLVEVVVEVVVQLNNVLKVQLPPFVTDDLQFCVADE